MARTLEPCCFMLAMVMRSSDRQTHSPRQNTCSWSARGSQLMPSARVFGPWPEHSNPAASCLQWSCALQAEAVDTFFFFACADLTRGRCCTSDLIAPVEKIRERFPSLLFLAAVSAIGSALFFAVAA